ncbi:MAG: hypothetical protein ACI350_04560 [Prevotella sp.]
MPELQYRQSHEKAGPGTILNLPFFRVRQREGQKAHICTPDNEATGKR